MTTAANVTCYIQPATGSCEFMAWVDTSKTAVVRRTVATKAEALAVIEEARQIARSLGGGYVIKKLVQTAAGASRAPAGTKALTGNEVI